MNDHSNKLRVIHPAGIRRDGDRHGRGVPELRTSWTADELMAMEFPQPRWAVPGILAEGVSLLAGPPKVGKSWLSLGLGLAIAAGGKAFDSIHVERRPGALPRPGRHPAPPADPDAQDPRRPARARRAHPRHRLPAPAPRRRRSHRRLAGPPPRRPHGRHRRVRQDARPSAPGMSAYDADYAAVGRAKRLADHYGVAVVLVHHVRKAGSDDFLAEVSGTNGLAGAADATLVLKRARGQADGVLHVTGRDVDEAEYALSFQPASGAWQLLDGPRGTHLRRHPRRDPAPRPRPPGQPAEGHRRRVGHSRRQRQKTCQRMAVDGQLGADTTAATAYRLHRGLLGLRTCPSRPCSPSLDLSCDDGPDREGQPTDTDVPAVPRITDPEGLHR